MAKKKKKQSRSWVPWVSGIAVLVIAFAGLAIFQQRQSTDMDAGEAGSAPGKQAPNFTLQSTQGKISLKDNKGKNVVIYFYEGNG